MSDTPDIVERLRHEGPFYTLKNRALRNEAADMIERLRERCEGYVGQVKAGSEMIDYLRSAAPAADGWQTIETAPKDGTQIVLAWGGRSIVAYYLNTSRTIAPWEGWKPLAMQTWPTVKPTHWQPLPVPPVVEAAPSPITPVGSRHREELK